MQFRTQDDYLVIPARNHGREESFVYSWTGRQKSTGPATDFINRGKVKDREIVGYYMPSGTSADYDATSGGEALRPIATIIGDDRANTLIGARSMMA